MVKHTDRDVIWSCAMKIALESMNIDGQHIKVKYIRRWLDPDPPSDRTIRDVLNTMTYQGWLKKETKHSHKWFAGEALRDLKFKELEGAKVGSIHNLTGKPDEN